MNPWTTHLRLVSFSCPHARLNDPQSDRRHRDRRESRRSLRMNKLAPAFALLLAGCSNVLVRPPGGDQAPVEQDAGGCRATAFYVPIAPESTFVGAYPFNAADPNPGWSDAAGSDVARRDHTEEACMEAKGYRKQQ